MGASRGIPSCSAPSSSSGFGRWRAIRARASLLGDQQLIECSDLCSGRDVDTKEDMEAIRDATRTVI